MAEIQGGSSGSFVMRDYRKGNWTVGETMVLIEAKKMDEERRIMKRSGSGSGDHGGDPSLRSIRKPAELRWKWVEDYCWKKGCLRSQNQCNDKWDNLMRDYKKVREYESRSAVVGENKELPSYWKLEKSERKERNLPTNMVPHIYEALVEVVEKREMGRVVVGGGASVSGSISPNPNIGYVMEMPMISGVHQSTVLSPPPPPLMQQQHLIQAQPIAAVHPLPAPLAAQPPPPLPYSQPIPPVGSDTDTSEHSDSPAKRRRRGASGGAGGGEQQQGISASGTVSASTSSEVGTAISRGASIIAEALQGCEEREERRHREIMSLHERRIQIEESKTEINRQGINGLVDAINKLANSIHALASNSNQSSAPK